MIIIHVLLSFKHKIEIVFENAEFPEENRT